MHPIFITILISLCINAILMYLVRNSERDGKPFKMMILTWIFLLVSTFIPGLNLVVTFVCLILTIMAYADDDLEFKEGFWLSRKI